MPRASYFFITGQWTAHIRLIIQGIQTINAAWSKTPPFYGGHAALRVNQVRSYLIDNHISEIWSEVYCETTTFLLLITHASDKILLRHCSNVKFETQSIVVKLVLKLQCLWERLSCSLFMGFFPKTSFLRRSSKQFLSLIDMLPPPKKYFLEATHL